MAQSAISPETGGEPPSALDGSRRAGLCVHFTSLPGPHGIGDIGDAARAFLATLDGADIRVWQFLPTGPTGYGNSPYQPLSAFAGNELLIGFHPLQRMGLLSEDEVAALECPPSASVDYGRVIPARQAALARAADRFASRAPAPVKAAYDDFLGDNAVPWLDDYALFRVLKTLHGERPWTEWAPRLARREPAALREALAAHGHAVERVRVLQFLFDRQWRELKREAGRRSIRLFGDMPIYIALDSADAWAQPELLLLDSGGRPSHVAGVPPDYFSDTGQLWGNPLYDWPVHADTGYRWWIDRVRHATAQCDLVRIDHFRGFESFWAVPANADTAREGEWRAGPGDALFDAMRAALGRLPIVAEDLGIITEGVRQLCRRQRIPGMKVLQFEVTDPAFHAAGIPKDCVCYTGTHDNDTTVGWFNGGAGDTRSETERQACREAALRVTGGSPETIHEDMIRLAFDSAAALAVAPLQDYLGLGPEARMNTPGTTTGNWCWRVREAQLGPAFRDGVAALVTAAGRG